MAFCIACDECTAECDSLIICNHSECGDCDNCPLPDCFDDTRIDSGEES